MEAGSQKDKLNGESRRPSLDVGSDVIDVVVDPHIGRQLRPHQVEGVIFLYKCVMGIQLEGSHGAILADEMGLGKTLQTIALVWTLLRQGPYGKPVIKRVMVLAPRYGHYQVTCY